MDEQAFEPAASSRGRSTRSTSLGAGSWAQTSSRTIPETSQESEEVRTDQAELSRHTSLAVNINVTLTESDADRMDVVAIELDATPSNDNVKPVADCRYLAASIRKGGDTDLTQSRSTPNALLTAGTSFFRYGDAEQAVWFQDEGAWIQMHLVSEKLIQKLMPDYHNLEVDDCVAFLQKVVNARREELGESDKSVVEALTALAFFYNQVGDLKKALGEFLQQAGTLPSATDAVFRRFEIFTNPVVTLCISSCVW